MSNKNKITDKRIVKLLEKIGTGANLSLDYSFLSTDDEVVGVYFNPNKLVTTMVDGIEVLVPEDGVGFLILTREEINNPNVKEFAMLLKKSYEERTDYDKSIIQ